MMSFWVVPWSDVAVDAVLLGDRHVEREQPGGGGVDRHRRVHLVERDAVEQRVHVALVGDRDADLADLAARQLVVGVVAGLGGEVERDREAGLALGEVLAVELVRLLRGGVARVGAHDPRPVALGQAVVASHASEDCMVAPPCEPRDRRHAPRPRPGDLRLSRSTGVIVDPGPSLLRRDAARGLGAVEPRGAAADPHPPRPRRRHGRALPALPGAARVRPRARRAAPGGPVEAARERRAAVRRRAWTRSGARSRRCPRSGITRPDAAARPSRASGSSTRPATRRTTSATCTRRRATRTSATWPASASRRSTHTLRAHAAARHRRRGLARLARHGRVLEPAGARA